MVEAYMPSQITASLIREFLGSPTESHFISKKRLNEIAPKIKSLDQDSTRAFIKNIFDGLSREDEYWDDNRRDSALELLRLVNPAKVLHKQTLQDYLGAVSKLNKDSEPLGSISSLLDAGIILKPHFPWGQLTVDRVENAWGKVADNFAGQKPDFDFIEEQAGKIIKNIPVPQQ